MESPEPHSTEIPAQLTGRQMLDAIVRQRWTVVLIAIGVTAAFVAASFFIAPVYRATVVMVPAESDRTTLGGLGSALSQFGGLASLAGLDVAGNGTATEEALAILRSRGFTEKFIADAKLLPELYSQRWDSSTRTWRGGISSQPTYVEAYRKFDRRVRRVSQDKKTGLISVQIDWRDPELAADWANALVETLNEEMRRRALVQTTASVAHLEKELASTNVVETREAISRLMAVQVNRRMLANVTREYAFRIVDRALPADPEQPLWPDKPLLALMGLALGCILGLAAAIWRDARRLRRTEAAPE